MNGEQILQIFISAWDRDHGKRKLRKLDPHDWIRTPKKPTKKKKAKAKS